jgi:spore coat-associated protein N
MAAARSRLAVALVALGVAFVACLGGDHGAARAAVGNATGPLIGSSQAGAAILTANGMAPGKERTGDIDVTNIGDTSGTFALGSTGLTGAPLARELDLDVEDIVSGHADRVVYSGKLASLSSVALGEMAQGESHHYRFTVSLPSDADDTYQGASSAVTFMWSATAPEPAVTPTPTPPASTAGGTGTTPPARATTAEGPTKATTAGGTVKLGATFTARERQKGTGGKISGTVTCAGTCRVSVSGTATSGTLKVKLKTVKRSLKKGERLRVKLTLPAGAQLALAGGRSVTVRLKLTAKVGTRVVTVRRTVRIAPAAR